MLSKYKWQNSSYYICVKTTKYYHLILKKKKADDLIPVKQAVVFGIN